ncbi:chemotaxis protein histidine kinase CheA [Bradyrhizobium diazoefficiens]
MAKDSDPLADAFGTKETGGLFSGLLAEESAFDRRMMWRLGSWGVAAVGAVVIAVMANQAQLGWRRDQVASADLVRQADRLQLLTRESQNEARRLAAAVETLNSDRDRLYSRVTVLEQGLDSVTGAIARQTAKPQDTPAPDAQPAAPSVAPVASMPSPSSDKPRAAAAKEQAKEPTKDTVKETAKEPSSQPPQSAAAASLVQQSPATTSALPMLPLVPSKSIMAPPDPAASKLTQPETTEKTTEKKPEPTPAPTEIAAASAKPPEATESEAPAIAVQQTRFAIDLGGANSIDGLRALWRGVTKSNPEVATLRPIIMIKEGTTGLGMQLRLGAGPLINAAAAAKLCAGLAENDRHCETTVFDGQRLSMRGGSEKGQEKSQDRIQEKNAEKNPDAAPQAETAPAPAPTAKPDKRRRSYSSKRSSKREEPAPAPAAQPAAPAKPETASAGSTLSSFFRR